VEAIVNKDKSIPNTAYHVLSWCWEAGSRRQEVRSVRIGDRRYVFRILKAILLPAAAFHGVVPCVAHFIVRFFGHQIHSTQDTLLFVVMCCLFEEIHFYKKLLNLYRAKSKIKTSQKRLRKSSIIIEAASVKGNPKPKKRKQPKKK